MCVVTQNHQIRIVVQCVLCIRYKLYDLKYLLVYVLYCILLKCDVINVTETVCRRLKQRTDLKISSQIRLITAQYIIQPRPAIQLSNKP